MQLNSDHRTPQEAPKYSRAVMETLAIIAYRQPSTRGEVEAIRGASMSIDILQALQNRGWLEVIGHKDTPGNPALYATTRAFLNDLGLRSLSELPTLTELDPHPAFEPPEVVQDPGYPQQSRIASGGSRADAFDYPNPELASAPDSPTVATVEWCNRYNTAISYFWTDWPQGTQAPLRSRTFSGEMYGRALMEAAGGGGLIQREFGTSANRKIRPSADQLAQIFGTHASLALTKAREARSGTTTQGLVGTDAVGVRFSAWPDICVAFMDILAKESGMTNRDLQASVVAWLGEVMPNIGGHFGGLTISMDSSMSSEIEPPSPSLEGEHEGKP